MVASKEELLQARQEFSKGRLEELSKKVPQFSGIEVPPGFCIYVTGSYGRLEASQHSDLDLFFVQKGDGSEDDITKIQKTLIDADLIRLTRDMGFPEFSADGRYLEVHQISRILDELGSPRDDYENLFTARMLLLLESRPIFNKQVYTDSIQAIVDSYYRDYHDHEKNFLPVFLVNDIIRFWKTLCLNFEHKRNRTEGRRKPDVHVKNFKLKFSRLLTCFSGIVALCGKGGKLTPQDVATVVELSPIDRLLLVAEDGDRKAELVEQLLEDYAWFLEQTGKAEQTVIDWIADRETRDMVFGRGRVFGQTMHDLVLEVSQQNGLTRYLLV